MSLHRFIKPRRKLIHLCLNSLVYIVEVTGLCDPIFALIADVKGTSLGESLRRNIIRASHREGVFLRIQIKKVVFCLVMGLDLRDLWLTKCHLSRSHVGLILC